MTIKGDEFIRRFLQHVLPHGFMRIRHYGWLSNASRARLLPKVRQAIVAHELYPQQEIGTASSVPLHPVEQPEPFQGIPCCHCKQGMMVVVERLRPAKAGLGLMAN